jgi:endogenous inhibitor of DNA gyrase (YacG/DUF329 family)
MIPLQATSLLDLWERARGLDPVTRAVTLSAAAHPAAAVEEIAALPLGRRDARLLGLRAPDATTLEATACCPACAERVEFGPEAALLLDAPAREPAPVAAGDHLVRWRLPDSRDALAAVRTADPRGMLLERCVLGATGPHGSVAPRELPEPVVAALEDAIGASDPLTEVRVAVQCPECGTAFVADLDLAYFVWAEVDARARALMRDVDVLARAYGWSEPEVLALGDERRAAYVELAVAGFA